MNKKLKVVLFVLLGTLLVAGLAVGGFFILKNASAVTTYNLQIVNAQGAPMLDSTRYLAADTENSFPINVKIETSNGQGRYSFSSSDPSVARVVLKDNQYYVNYYKAGKTIITACSLFNVSVYDKFTLSVYDNYVTNIKIPEQQGDEDNLLTIHGDGSTRTYTYVATGVLDSVNSDCNNMKIRVLDNYNKEVFKSISVDPTIRKLTIKTNLVTADSQEVFYLQTYYVDAQGNERVMQNYAYYVNIIGYRLEQMQLILSHSDKNSDFINVCVAEGDSLTDAWRKASESFVSTAVLTDSYDIIYFKVRVIYSNKEVKDISSVNNIIIKQSTEDTNLLQFVTGYYASTTFWTAKLGRDVESGNVLIGNDKEFTFSLSYTDEMIGSTVTKTFKILYKKEGTNSYQTFVNQQLYTAMYNDRASLDADVASNSYDNVAYFIYSYWDLRYSRTDVQTNGNQQIIRFTGENPPKPPRKIIGE